MPEIVTFSFATFSATAGHVRFSPYSTYFANGLTLFFFSEHISPTVVHTSLTAKHCWIFFITNFANWRTLFGFSFATYFANCRTLLDFLSEHISLTGGHC